GTFVRGQGRLRAVAGDTRAALARVPEGATAAPELPGCTRRPRAPGAASRAALRTGPPTWQLHMRICFAINDLETERAEYTTTRLAVTARAMGHEAWYADVGNFAYDPDGAIAVRACAAPKQKYTSRESFLQDLRGPKAQRERLRATDLDVILLRNDPASDAVERPWAAQSGVVFGRRATQQGVIVLNNPEGLAQAVNKMYFQDFPEEVRPRTLI